jgi:hypothetical protein
MGEKIKGLSKSPFLVMNAKGGESISPKQKDRTTTSISPKQKDHTTMQF